jgi:hypothetical protein
MMSLLCFRIGHAGSSLVWLFHFKGRPVAAEIPRPVVSSTARPHCGTQSSIVLLQMRLSGADSQTMTGLISSIQGGFLL